MTYSSGGIISAADYNSFSGGLTANTSGQINSLLATGRGNTGYGQTSIANVSVSGSVTATQWTTLVNGINTIRKHQTGAGFTNVGTYTAGTTINATNDVAGNLTAAFTNRLTYGAQGTTTTGTVVSPVFTLGSTTSAATFSLSRTATFSSADAARYFFNAGGQLNFVITGITNNDGTVRSASLVNLGNNFGSKKVGAQDCVAKTGTGNATVTTDATTNAGYYVATTSNVTKTQLTSTQSTYTGDILYFYAKSNGAQGVNGDAGTVVTLSMDLTSGTQTGGFNDSINITVNHRVDVIYPQTAYLANTWGTVTIA